MIAHDRVQKPLDFEELQEVMANIIAWLEGSDSKTKLIYHYTTATLMIAQKSLIELGLHFLGFCDFVNELLREKYYEILVKILYRSELDLSMLDLVAHVKKDVRQSQIHIISIFRQFINAILKNTIQNMSQRNVETYKREFVEVASATCFFRMP